MRVVPSFIRRGAIPVVPSIAILGVGIPAAVIPREIEGVSLRSARRIFDSNHGGASVPRIPNQLLPPPAIDAAKAEGEKSWHMPLDDDYKELLKSAFADLANIGGRWGGAISAAYFLKEFAGDTPWVHLDIAGTAWLDEAKPFLAKGPSGVAVRTFTRLALDW